jgi:peptide deformylase
MALRKIRLWDDPLIRKKSKPVKEVTNKIKILLDDMHDTLIHADGLGLAAPQVGVLKRIVIIEYEDRLYELINPEIIESSGTQRRTEGCLSIPGKNGLVERPAYVKVRAQDRDGNEIIVDGEELLAVALCHELDHLDGVLYMDKALEMYDITRPDEDETGEVSEEKDAQ